MRNLGRAPPVMRTTSNHNGRGDPAFTSMSSEPGLRSVTGGNPEELNSPIRVSGTDRNDGPRLSRSMTNNVLKRLPSTGHSVSLGRLLGLSGIRDFGA